MDAGIHALAEKKLKLDAAVLDGLAASAKQTKADENAGMTELLQTVLTGEHTPLLPSSCPWVSASASVWLAVRMSHPDGQIPKVTSLNRFAERKRESNHLTLSLDYQSVFFRAPARLYYRHRNVRPGTRAATRKTVAGKIATSGNRALRLACRSQANNRLVT